MEVSESVFGELDGMVIKSYAVKTKSGMEFTCIDYGCIITNILMPDKTGIKESVVLGFDTLEEYERNSHYFGSIIGRVSGRIEKAEFTLDGNTYKLAKNENGNHLHGGPNGFHRAVWDSSLENSLDEAHITFTYTSPDGEEGFPGELKIEVTYTVNESNELIISYRGVSNKTTLVNLTNHSYFNLSGNLKRDILSHELILKSDRFLVLDSSFIPTGRVEFVENTAFDFRESKKLGMGIDSSEQQIELVGGGYDHPFLLNINNQEEICLFDRESGRKLEMETDQPCVVIYSGNSLQGDIDIRGKKAQKHLGVCLETQIPPNMISNPSFATAKLAANEIYESRTKYAFKVMQDK
ncbi:galactose mutarotase [Bacillus sp. SD075]|uniref:aldose epimerase family protein n=1 Tax=Bacillus sp. SD075 TaxID=2781732 RepID=UPI001A9575BF|nr:aldose epimerase family protein [Bacillus sp. SD075]MBO0997195.1 galactose mutarotase [Bacillus sp. SD075]